MSKCKEWWVIEDSRKRGVLSTEEQNKPKGYIPRDVGERIIGRKTKNGECIWFTQDQIRRIKLHPQYRCNLNDIEGGE